MDTIEASAETLMHQAPKTVALYLENAIAVIDAAFDVPGYAAQHPALVAAFLEACVRDCAAMTLAAAVQGHGEHLYSAFEMFYEELPSLIKAIGLIGCPD